MRKINYLIIILLLLGGTFKLHAQEDVINDSIHFSGMIMDRDSLKALPYAKYSLHNINFIANENGEFHLWAFPGDVIKFSYVGYKDTYIQVNDTLIENNYLIGVFLSKDTVQLSEVIVVPRYRQLLMEAKYSPLSINPEYDNAIQTVEMAKKQALSKVPEDLASKAAPQTFVKEQTIKTAYTTQVPPNMIFGIHMDRLVPYIVYLSQKKKMKVQKVSEQDIISSQEKQFLINLYKRDNQTLRSNQSVIVKDK